MIPETKTNGLERETIIGMGTAVRVGVLLTIVSVVWWGATLTSDVNTIKSALVRLNNVDVLFTRMELLSTRFDTLEKRGSEPMQALQKSVDKIANDLETHIKITTKGNTQ